MIRLRGITWNHTRGFTPLVACAQRFSEQFPEADVTWTKRSLLEFGETPVEQLAEKFDLLVIDHPFTGFAAAQKIFLPLNQHVSAATLAAWHEGALGAAAHCYDYAGQTWAAPIDTACPIAVWRPDLLVKHEALVPGNWDELLALAARRLVLIPGTHTDAIHHFYMLCLARGGELRDAEAFLPDAIVHEALEELARLYALVPEPCWTMNPIQVHESLAAVSSEHAYCPFAFGYSNYSRRGYCDHPLKTGTPPRWRDEPLRTTLGGTGLAISRHCAEPAWAAKLVEFVAAPETQQSLYWQNGGQPAQQSAWTDSTNDRESNGFLSQTRSALETAWVRPRFPGYLHFQDRAAHVVHAALCRREPIPISVRQLNLLWREARELRRQYEQ